MSVNYATDAPFGLQNPADQLFHDSAESEGRYGLWNRGSLG